jgi:hypothetical protein
MRLVVLVVALVTAGCVEGMGYSTKDRVTMAAREYNDGVRWGKYEQVARFVTSDRRKRFVERHKDLDDELEIADYELTGIDVDKKKDRATAHVDYTWTLKRTGLVERTSTDQHWEERDGEWVVSSEVRTKGSPLVLFDEVSHK